MSRNAEAESVRSRARIPFAVIVIGLVLTASMASLQRSSAAREQSLLFERQVTQERERFVDQLDATIENFDNAVSFIEATYPSTIDEYTRFFANSERSDAIELDPGILLVEPVLPEDIPALIAREADLGNPDMRVLSLWAPIEGPRRVITRAAQPISIGGISIIGLDVSALTSESLTNLELPENGRATFVIDSAGPLGFVFETAANDGFEGSSLVSLVQSIDDPTTGEARAWATQFFDPLFFIGDLPEQLNPTINVQVEMLGVTELISAADPENAEFADSPLRAELSDDSHDLPWTLKMWAVDDLGVGTGVFDQVEPWIFGLLATLALAIVSVWHALQDHRLDEAEFELEHALTLASTDPLTGLLNRQGFIEMVQRMDHLKGGSVFFIDLDGFKEVNDTRGHAQGDRVLRDVAERLSKQFRSDDFVSRFGGDEFVVYTPGLIGQPDISEMSARVCKAVSGIDKEISASLGTATLSPNSSRDFDEVLNEADRAMYRAKESGGNRYESARQ